MWRILLYGHFTEHVPRIRAELPHGICGGRRRHGGAYWIGGYLDTHLPWDPQQCRVSPGTRLLALMVTFLVDPRALYRIPAFYTEWDCAVLFGAERQPADFNDDAMGRALEKLFESQASQIHTGLGTQAVERLGLDPTPPRHCDTTRLTLMGQYPDPGAGSQPAYGHNKDGHGHPDCKQLVVEVVARTDGLPYAVDVCDGNMDDPTWSRQAVLNTGSTLVADVRATLLFVADSKISSCFSSGDKAIVVTLLIS